MPERKEAYGNLIRFRRDGESSGEILRRLPLGMTSVEGGIDEATIQDLLFRNPEALPIDVIDNAYTAPVALCRELSTPAGYIDAVYVNAMGRLILAEFKLWRNPQARREVIGQILDYAKEVAAWQYEDFQREISRVTGQKGNVPYELVKVQNPDLNEAEFVDNVSRHLSHGEFLLLIVGDGIREGVESIVDYVQQYSGLHFRLALIEAALFEDSESRLLLQPRCLARTEIVQRFAVGDGTAEPEDAGGDESLPEHAEENELFWADVLENFTFADTTIEVPETTNSPTLYVKVRNSGWGDWGLSFAGYRIIAQRRMGCYLTCRKDIEQAVRVFGELEADFDVLRDELGDELQKWQNASHRPRIGFQFDESFLIESTQGEETGINVSAAWMRKYLDRLVSSLNPKLQKMLVGPE